MRKPDNIVYWLEDSPPPRIALGLAIQQVAFLGALLVLPSLFIHQLGLSYEAFLDLSAATLIVSGAALFLQAWNRHQIGSGYFVPLQGTTSVLPALFLASQASGNPAATFGVVAIIGLSQIVFSYIIVRLRSIFTVEVAGLSVVVIGIGLGQNGLRLIFGAHADTAITDPVTPVELAIAGLTLATMIFCNVWVKSKLRLFATLCGLLVGFAASWFAGLIVPAELQALDAAPIFRLPNLPVFGWGWSTEAVIPSIITGFALALLSMGVQTIAQRFNDADWVRPDLAAISRGVRAEGVTHLFAALLNGLPMAASGGAASMAAASGCTSRYLAYWTGGLLVLFAFLPKLVLIWLLLPPQVTGALFIFLSAFTTFSGMQLITSRMLDNRRVLALGIGLLFYISYEVMHADLQRLPLDLQHFVFSSFAIAILTAVLLSSLFRIGIRKGTRRTFLVAETHLDEVVAFMEQQGRLWGARHAVIGRAEHATWQAFELLVENGLLAQGAAEIGIETRFDEFTFIVTMDYKGGLPELVATPPSHDELLEDEGAEARMAGYLITKLADSARASQTGERSRLRLTFEN